MARSEEAPETQTPPAPQIGSNAGAEISQPEAATGPEVRQTAPAAPANPLFPVPDKPVVLSVQPPAGSLTVDDVVITTEPAEFGPETVARAREAAWLAGISLKEH